MRKSNKKPHVISVIVLTLLIPGIMVIASACSSSPNALPEENQTLSSTENNLSSASNSSSSPVKDEADTSSKTGDVSTNPTTKDNAQNSTLPSSASSSESSIAANENSTIPSAVETNTDTKEESSTASQAEKPSADIKDCNTGEQLQNVPECNVEGKACTNNSPECTEYLKRFGVCLPGCENTTSSCPTNSTPTPTPDNSTPATPEPVESSTPSIPDNQNVDNLSFEEQVVVLVNEQRAANGLSPLTLNQDVSNVARAKSQDMHDNNYFAHTSPTYGSPFDMLTSFGISYRAAGENIAMGYSTPEAVMEGWMNSSGHRANILNASFTQIGVGYVADGNYWTQQFIG
ncbi:CAP domain-containing protein [Scatolibacter rhodanostii]|uniref:CAP domain-containing protein n=1 Tax=Scatolibacter rhodanostii TaxID=2014781 RepID=UPI001FA92218|nr:CAP domain-containing protein [Scatolibacter rhodanostii]